MHLLRIFFIAFGERYMIRAIRGVAILIQAYEDLGLK